MSQDVWQGSDAESRGETSPELAHGEGWAKKRSFSYETVVYGGIAILKEQPAAIALWTVFLVVLSFASSCITTPVTLGVQVAVEGAGLDANSAMAVNQIVAQSAAMLVQVPVQQFCMAGLMAFVGHYVRTDQAEISLLFTNIWGGIRATLVTWVLSAVYMAVFMPAMVVGLGVYLQTNSVETGLITLGGMYLLTLPVMLFMLPLSLAVTASVVDEVGPLDAITSAWRAGSGARVEIFLMSLVVFLITLVLMLLCCLPVLLAPSIYSGGMAVAWLTYAREESEVESWAFIQRNFEG